MFLAQRMHKSNFEKLGKGVDVFTTFEYMGSSEYEWGALPKAMKALRAQTNLKFREFEHEGHPVFFIGETSEFENIADVLNQKRWKESPRFPWQWGKSKTGGWFMLDADKPFVVFVDSELALLWAQELNVEI